MNLFEALFVGHLVGDFLVHISLRRETATDSSQGSAEVAPAKISPGKFALILLDGLWVVEGAKRSHVAGGLIVKALETVLSIPRKHPGS